LAEGLRIGVGLHLVDQEPRPRMVELLLESGELVSEPLVTAGRVLHGTANPVLGSRIAWIPRQVRTRFWP